MRALALAFLCAAAVSVGGSRVRADTPGWHASDAAAPLVTEPALTGWPERARLEKVLRSASQRGGEAQREQAVGKGDSLGLGSLANAGQQRLLEWWRAWPWQGGDRANAISGEAGDKEVAEDEDEVEAEDDEDDEDGDDEDDDIIDTQVAGDVKRLTGPPRRQEQSGGIATNQTGNESNAGTDLEDLAGQELLEEDGRCDTALNVDNQYAACSASLDVVSCLNNSDW